MVHNFPKITVKSEIELYQAWLVATNWRHGKLQLTEEEMTVLSYFLYFNNEYKKIEDDYLRYEVLFSTSTKKKIKEKFDVSTTKLENYLNKLRKKGIINNNQIDPRFIVYPDSKLQIMFSFELSNIKTEKPVINIPEVKEELPAFEEEEDDLEEEEIEEVVEEPEQQDLAELYKEIKKSTPQNNLTSKPANNLYNKYMNQDINKTATSSDYDPIY